MAPKLPLNRLLSNGAFPERGTGGDHILGKPLTENVFSVPSRQGTRSHSVQTRPCFWTLTRAPCSRLLRHLCEARFPKDFLVFAPGDVAERLKALVC